MGIIKEVKGRKVIMTLGPECGEEGLRGRGADPLPSRGFKTLSFFLWGEGLGKARAPRTLGENRSAASNTQHVSPHLLACGVQGDTVIGNEGRVKCRLGRTGAGECDWMRVLTHFRRDLDKWYRVSPSGK